MIYYIVSGIRSNGEEDLIYSGDNESVATLNYERNDLRYVSKKMKSANIKEFILEKERDIPKLKMFCLCDYCGKRLYKDIDDLKYISIKNNNENEEIYSTVACTDCASEISLSVENADLANHILWHVEDEYALF